MNFITEIFNDAFVFRWLHVWFGIIWIGTLYYFNFMQTPFMGAADTEGPTKSRVTRGLLPRALWWFRWGAMGVFLTGCYLWYFKYQPSMGVYWTSAGGLPITLGATMGTLMFLNVWLIIWPKQKIIIANAIGVADGKAADPRVAASAARAGVASRTNTLFSIPLVFFMLAGSHYGYHAEKTDGTFYGVLALVMVIIFGIEFNAVIGKMRKPLATVNAVVTSGFVLWAVLYVLTRAVSVP